MMEKSVNLNSIFQVFSSELNQIKFPDVLPSSRILTVLFPKKSLFTHSVFLSMLSVDAFLELWTSSTGVTLLSKEENNSKFMFFPFFVV